MGQPKLNVIFLLKVLNWLIKITILFHIQTRCVFF